MRSLPQAGSQTTLSISSMASWRKVVSRSIGALHRGFKTDEPLLGGAEDDGMMAAPAMRIGVRQIGGGQQGAAFSSSMATMMGLAAHTLRPSKAGGAARGQASGST